MSLNKDDINKIAHLARLNINNDFQESITQDLNNILNLVDKIQKIDVTNIKPMAHSTETKQRLAKDAVLETNVRDAMQKIAPHAESGLYLVPQVVE